MPQRIQKGSTKPSMVGFSAEAEIRLDGSTDFLGGLGGTSVPLAKSKRRRAGRCPPPEKVKITHHSPSLRHAGAGVPIRMEHAQNNGTQLWPMLCNRLKKIRLALESIESTKKSTPYPSLHQISQWTPQPRGISWRRPETTTAVRGPNE